MEEHIQENYEQPIQEEVVQEEAQPEQVQAQPVEDKKWRDLRVARDRLQKENADLQNRLKQIEESKKSLYDNDDLVPRKYVDEQVQRIERQFTQNAAEYKLKSQYPDFDKVVNDATISELKARNPALANAIGQVGDTYSQAAAAYEAIKNLGLYVEDQYAQDRNMAQINASKPRPSQAAAPSKNGNPLASASEFAQPMNKQQKEALWNEMQFFKSQRN